MKVAPLFMKITFNEKLKKPNIRFKLYNNLVYYIFDNGRERLYISYSLKKEVFYIVYDLSNYREFY